MIIFLTIKLFTVSFSMKLLIGCLEAFLFDIKGDQMGRSVYAMGRWFVASVHVHMTGVGWVIF